MNLFIAGCDHRRVRAVTRLFSLVALIRLAFTSDSDVIALPSFLFFPLLFFSLLRPVLKDRDGEVLSLDLSVSSPAMHLGGDASRYR